MGGSGLESEDATIVSSVTATQRLEVAEKTCANGLIPVRRNIKRVPTWIAIGESANMMPGYHFGSCRGFIGYRTSQGRWRTRSVQSTGVGVSANAYGLLSTVLPARRHLNAAAIQARNALKSW